MDIVVTLKQVPDPNIPPAHIELDTGGLRIISPYGIPPVMNGYDANALEEAIRLKEAHGGRVTVFSLGDDGAREVLKQSVAMGADAAILLDDPDWLDLDSAGVANVLAAAVRKIGNCDVVLSGRQASDTDGGQVLHWLAQALGFTSVTPVTKIEGYEDGKFVVHRMIEDGYQRISVALPAMLGVSSEINEPRTPSMRGMMAANRVMVPSWKAGDIELAPYTPKVELRELKIQLSTERAELIPGATGAEQGEALANKLHELGLI